MNEAIEDHRFQYPRGGNSERDSCGSVTSSALTQHPPALRCAAMFWVIVATDWAGSVVQVLEDDDELPGGEWRYRTVLRTPDRT